MTNREALYYAFSNLEEKDPRFNEWIMIVKNHVPSIKNAHLLDNHVTGHALRSLYSQLIDGIRILSESQSIHAKASLSVTLKLLWIQIVSVCKLHEIKINSVINDSLY